MMNLEVLFVPYPVKNAQGEYEVVESPPFREERMSTSTDSACR